VFFGRRGVSDDDYPYGSTYAEAGFSLAMGSFGDVLLCASAFILLSGTSCTILPHRRGARAFIGARLAIDGRGGVGNDFRSPGRICKRGGRQWEGS
jgi:hypothetical protein